MTDDQNRRARGDHYCKWDEGRQRWKARASVGYDARGKRIYVARFGTSQSAALAELRKALRERDKGVTAKVERYLVSEAVTDWLEFGLTGRDPSTIKSFRSVASTHVIPHLGGAKINNLTVRDVEKWLRAIAPKCSRATLAKARMVLRRSIRRAIAHELAIRNVAEYCDLPEGRKGRPSKSFTATQADAILKQTKSHRMHAYIVVSMLTGARTEEMRELTWDHVVLDQKGKVPPHMMVWRSVRKNGETKTKRSRRTIALPRLCVDVLQLQRERQGEDQATAGTRWQSHPGYVFATGIGTKLDVNNTRRYFRDALKGIEGITPADWTPRELRHSFVSLLSDAGVPIEDISRLVGHAGTSVTELVYRHQIRPVVETGAEVMDTIFNRSPDAQLDAQGESSAGTDDHDGEVGAA